jgi:hypothetical protein
MVPVGLPHPSPCGRPDLAAALVDFDELPAAERAALGAHARACPSCGPALRLLEAAQAHLGGLAAGSAIGDCPAAEELFDFARAPGARPLSAPRAAAVGAHAERCADCRELLAGLAARPPSPLIFDPPSEPVRSQPPARRRLRRLGPLLASAAGLLAVLALWRSNAGELAGPRQGEALGVAFPAAEVLRGDQGGALLWPRGALLSPPAAEGGLRFELELPERAGAWRVRVQARADDPFAPGREVATLAGTGPLGAAEALPPGAYTWEAWAEVDGLDVHLGRRDFDVRADGDVAAELARLAAAPEPERSSGILALLAARGYHADARAWARTLPPGPARDEFLARTPAR